MRGHRIAARAVASSLALFSATAEAAEADPNAVEPPTVASLLVVKIRTTAPKKSPWGEVLINLSRRLERASKDAHGKPRIDVRVDWRVPSEARVVKACEAGKGSGLFVSLRALTPSVPELEAIELPYLFDGYAAADRALEAAAPLLSELLHERGFVYALRAEGGFRHWAARTSLVVPMDFKGRVLRSHGTSASRASIAALGATAIEIVPADVAAKLTGDTVVGYDETLLMARLARWSSEIGFVTLSGHSYDAAGLVWCKAWLDTLPPDLQGLFERRADRTELEASGLALMRRFNDELMPRQYERDGVRMRELSSDERGALKAALAPVELAFAATTSPKGRELLTILKR